MKLTRSWWAAALGIVLVALGMMFLSIWRQLDKQVEYNLIGTERGKNILTEATNSGELAKIEQGGTHEPLPHLSYLPHHPLYFVGVFYERVKLWLTKGELNQAKLMIDYANERMGVASQLLGQGRGREAIEAGTKGYMYDLQAAEQLKRIHGTEATDQWQRLAASLRLQEQAMTGLEMAVTDNFKPKVDLIVSGLIRLRLEAETLSGGN